MSTHFKIFRQGVFYVPKKFQRQVPKPETYLVKPPGDTEEKKVKTRRRKFSDTANRKENRLFLEIVEKLDRRKYLKRKNKKRNKIRSYDTTESV
jgi:hypothetical protein